MGGTRRTPRCRGGRPVSPYPIDRRLRLCALVGAQHLFVVVRRLSLVVSGVGVTEGDMVKSNSLT